MIKARNIRQLVEQCNRDGTSFKNKFREMLGIQMKNYPEGNFPHHVDKSKAQLDPTEFSIRELVEEFMGHDFVAGLHNDKLYEHSSSKLQEALSPITPSVFTDINAFSSSIGGLIEVKILEGYRLPEFIGDQMVNSVPTRVNGGKIIGVAEVSGPDEYTQPGEEMQSQGMAERWAIASPNLKLAQKLSLSRESVVYDLSGELLASAESVGRALGLGKECQIAATIMGINVPANKSTMIKPGITGNSYRYDAQPTDSPNNSYQATAGSGSSAKYNFINLLASNTLVDYTSVQSVRGQLNLQRSYETNFPIAANLEIVIVSPQVEFHARQVIHALQVYGVSGGGTTNFPTLFTYANNPIDPPGLAIRASNIWNKLLVDIGFSQANADALWYGGSTRSAFQYREVWPLAVAQANPSSADMMEKEIVNAWYCSVYGVPCVLNPRYMIANGATPSSPS